MSANESVEMARIAEAELTSYAGLVEMREAVAVLRRQGHRRMARRVAAALARVEREAEDKEDGPRVAALVHRREVGA